MIDNTENNSFSLQLYETGLRELVYLVFGIHIPEIPGICNTLTNILLLEQILHVNGKGKYEQAYFENHKECLNNKELKYLIRHRWIK